MASRVSHIQTSQSVMFLVSQVKGELATVSKVDQSSQSFARSNYEVSCEAAVNDQVNFCKTATNCSHNHDRLLVIYASAHFGLCWPRCQTLRLLSVSCPADQH